MANYVVYLTEKLQPSLLENGSRHTRGSIVSSWETKFSTNDTNCVIPCAKSGLHRCQKSWVAYRIAGQYSDRITPACGGLM